MSDTGRQAFATRWRRVGMCLRFFSAPSLAVACLITIAAVLVLADWLEARRGREWVHWKIYGSFWFGSLLGITMIGAVVALIRRPWRWRDGGKALAHVGLLVLLIGAGWSQYSGAAGQIILGERQSADRATNRERTQIVVERTSEKGRRSSQFSFAPGVEDWPSGKRLVFPAADGVALRVVKFVRHAQSHVDWRAADQDAEAAAVRLTVVEQGNPRPTEEWLTASLYGGELYVGAARFVLWPLSIETMVADFLDPPTDLGEAGVLSVHFQGRMHRFRIDEVRGQTVPIGDTGAAIEFVEYYPDAKPQPDGRKFISRSNQPKNPVLELRVHLPNEPEPLRQLAFAKSPLLNLDGVLGRACPVRFWFHHAGPGHQAGVVFAQTPAGKLFARQVVDGNLVEATEVQVNATLPMDQQGSVTVIRHLPKARREVAFTSSESVPDQSDALEAAVQIDLSVDGTERTLWLSQGENEFSYQTFWTSSGLASVSCGYQQLELGNQIELAQLQPTADTADNKQEFEACVLNMRESPGDVPVTQTVVINHPLQLGAYRLCLTGFQELSQRQPAAVFVVSRDPGRSMKYLGCGLILCGLAWMAFARVSSNGQ